MNSNLYSTSVVEPLQSPPDETWLFAQAISGKPIPDPHAAQQKARLERERLRTLAQFSQKHATELYRLEFQEAEARRYRELLVWSAGICDKAKEKLDAILRAEAKVRDAQRIWEQYYNTYLETLVEWEEADHPRDKDGKWVSKGGGADGEKKPSIADNIKRHNSDIELWSQPNLPKGFDPAKGFASFRDFKNAFGAAGQGKAWHHIVEQTINSGKFAQEILHNPANLLKLPHGKESIHARLSGYYSSSPRFTNGLTVRQWLSKKSFKEQFDFGIKAIKDFGGAEYLPPHLR